ncbi:MAG: hypothetical protein OEO23_03810 [Gemmatimonadota bacterium]|nr:hypothetical protein [Gemmatimonadota bacterium]
MISSSTVAWVAILLVSLGAMIAASRMAVEHAQALVFGTRMPPFLVGVTFLAVGTDLPEIANSITASFAGHGDVNVGDSIGSTATQATLVLGLLPWLGGAMDATRKRVLLACGLCIIALAAGGWFVADGFLSRTDAAFLVMGWVLGSVIMWRWSGPSAEPALPVSPLRPARHAVMLLLALSGLAAAAVFSVLAFVKIADQIGVPEYLLTFFVSSLGTSLPELLVDVGALRRGLKDLALGDVLGSSFVDATLSIGIGPLLAPTLVDGSLGLRGALTTMGALACVGLILALRKSHDRLSGSLLIGVYAGVYLVLLR